MTQAIKVTVANHAREPLFQFYVDDVTHLPLKGHKFEVTDGDKITYLEVYEIVHQVNIEHGRVAQGRLALVTTIIDTNVPRHLASANAR